MRDCWALTLPEQRLITHSHSDCMSFESGKEKEEKKKKKKKEKKVKESGWEKGRGTNNRPVLISRSLLLSAQRPFVSFSLCMYSNHIPPRESREKKKGKTVGACVSQRDSACRRDIRKRAERCRNKECRPTTSTKQLVLLTTLIFCPSQHGYTSDFLCWPPRAIIFFHDLLFLSEETFAAPELGQWLPKQMKRPEREARGRGKSSCTRSKQSCRTAQRDVRCTPL